MLEVLVDDCLGFNTLVSTVLIIEQVDLLPRLGVPSCTIAGCLFRLQAHLGHYFSEEDLEVPLVGAAGHVVDGVNVSSNTAIQGAQTDSWMPWQLDRPALDHPGLALALPGVERGFVAVEDDAAGIDETKKSSGEDGTLNLQPNRVPLRSEVNDLGPVELYAEPRVQGLQLVAPYPEAEAVVDQLAALLDGQEGMLLQGGRAVGVVQDILRDRARFAAALRSAANNLVTVGHKSPEDGVHRRPGLPQELGYLGDAELGLAPTVERAVVQVDDDPLNMLGDGHSGLLDQRRVCRAENALNGHVTFK